MLALHAQRVTTAPSITPPKVSAPTAAHRHRRASCSQWLASAIGHHVATVHALYIPRNSKRLSTLANRTGEKLFAGGRHHLPREGEDP